MTVTRLCDASIKGAAPCLEVATAKVQVLSPRGQAISRCYVCEAHLAHLRAQHAARDPRWPALALDVQAIT